jgi:WD40 repeat protein
MKKYFLLIAIFILHFPLKIHAAEPLIWSVNSRADVLKGDSRGVSIDFNGKISPAPKLNEIFNTGQSYIWSSVVDTAGNFYLGTGADGKIFKIDTNGKGSLLADLNELNVSALAIGRDGEIFAATSPDGKVYRLDANGRATVYFEPQEKYIWALAVLADGSLAVGTGENGKIFKVRSANVTPESSLLFDTSEAHIISLAADKTGNLFAGTDSGGLVLRFGSDGKPFALLDSPLREIHELAIGTDGSVYALALSDSVSTKTEKTEVTEIKPVSVEKTTVQAEPTKSRYDLSAAKSAVYRIFPDGGNDIIWSSPNVVGFSLHAQQNGSGVLLGTSDKGRIYSIANDGRETLVLQSNEGQVSTIKSSGQSFFATSSNQGKFFRFGAETDAEATYESAVLDAKASAVWGRIWWRANGNVILQTRSGNTEKPDETWSDWSSAYTEQKGAQIASPKAKYLQWQAVFRGSGNLHEVNVSFLTRNIAPEILSVQVLPTNVALVANPPVQIDPNIEFSGIDLSVFGIQIAVVPPRRIFQRGAKALQWTAEDRNGDELLYDIYYREVSETNFKLLKENLTDNFYTIDGQTLADGRYEVKIVAKDSLSNPTDLTLFGEKISEPFDIDNTPPNISVIGTPSIAGDKARVVFEATDAASFVARAEFSVNGGEWQTIYAEDGISDSPKERFTVEFPVKTAGGYSVILRVFDANGNAGNARAIVKK